MAPVIQNHFNDSYEFTSEMGFQVAFAMVSYDTSSDSGRGKEYGEAKMYSRILGQVN